MQHVHSEEPASTSRPSSRQQGIVRRPAPPLDPVPKGRARKALVPPYLRIGGKRSMLERAMKERLLECPKPRRKERTRDSQSSQGLQGDLEERPENTLQPFPRLRKPAEVVEVELDQLRVQLQKEIRERRRDARRRRQMRRRCRLQDTSLRDRRDRRDRQWLHMAADQNVRPRSIPWTSLDTNHP